MSVREHDAFLKILLIGDSGVGKNLILNRYADGVTIPDNYMTTIGVDFKIKTEEIDGRIVRLQIWDTAGEERFRSITSSYYRGASAIMFVFDATDRESFVGVKKWLEEVEKYAPENIVKVALCNNADLSSARVVETNEATEFFTQCGMQYFEVSTRTGSNITEAFRETARECLSRHPCGRNCNDNENEESVTPASSSSSASSKSGGGCIVC